MSIARARGIVPLNSGAYSTSFPLTENPISEGGKWTLGGDTGLDWQNIRTNGGSPGIAYGVGTTPINQFTDCIGCIKNLGLSTRKFYTRIQVRMAAAYNPAADHEIELLFFDILPHVNKGYEISIQWQGAAQPIRQNGAISDYDTTVFTTLSGGTFGVADGDWLGGVFDSTSGSPVITLDVNGVPQWIITDTTAGKILDLYPGMGFFAHPDASIDMTKYCANGFAAGNA